MAQAIRKIAKSVQKGEIKAKDIDAVRFEKEMYTGDCPDMDIMVRTSGETRFSDFMIWQSCDNCSIEFINTLWPAMGNWDMFKILFKYSYKMTKYLKTEEIRQSKRADVMKAMNPNKKSSGLSNKSSSSFVVTGTAAPVPMNAASSASSSYSLTSSASASSSSPSTNGKSGRGPPKVSITEVARNDVVLANPVVTASA